MRVLAIQGSPHRGNTFRRVERFGRVLEDLGGVEFEHLALKDVDLEPCRGCFLCFQRGEEKCPIRDDKQVIERKIEDADAVVFATPVYSMTVSTLLKRFVDRFAYVFHRPRYFGKYAVGLAVAGAVGLKETLRYIEMFAGSWGFEYVGSLRYVDPPVGTGFPHTAPKNDPTEETVRGLHSRLTSRPPRRVSMQDCLQFHCMRAVYSRMEPFSPTDFAYWKERGWLEAGARYFTPDARGSRIKSLVPRVVAWMIGRGFDREIARWRASKRDRPTQAGETAGGEEHG